MPPLRTDFILIIFGAVAELITHLMLISTGYISSVLPPDSSQRMLVADQLIVLTVNVFPLLIVMVGAGDLINRLKTHDY